jgi:hypothetical protein
MIALEAFPRCERACCAERVEWRISAEKESEVRDLAIDRQRVVLLSQWLQYGEAQQALNPAQCNHSSCNRARAATGAFSPPARLQKPLLCRQDHQPKRLEANADSEQTNKHDQIAIESGRLDGDRS